MAEAEAIEVGVSIKASQTYVPRLSMVSGVKVRASSAEEELKVDSLSVVRSFPHFSVMVGDLADVETLHVTVKFWPITGVLGS